MPFYKVKPGMNYGRGGIYKAGDILELTEAEAEFPVKLGKLELIEEGQALESPVPALKNDLKVEVPEDLKIMPESETFRINEEPAKPKPRTQRKPRKASE